jgi:hypothetical protein
VGSEVDEAFKLQARGIIPSWAEPMIGYSKVVEWMRRQHWKNNKNKAPLASGSGESTAGISKVADGGSIGAAPSGEASTGTGAGASGYWMDVM